MSSYYVTTPIYYVNDVPHIGHAYTTVVADVLARFHRMRGEDVYFLTGTDEHGQKIEGSAKSRGWTPIQLADEVVQRYHALWKRFGITHDDFIRTTEKRHKEGVYRIFEKISARGDVYKGKYEGWYCKGCEAFFPESQLIDGKCPEQQHPVERLSEESYFFKLSKYGPLLLDHYRQNPDFIFPETRRNEIVAFVKSGLRDLSVSRTSFRWGIPYPDDNAHIFYVWFDALSNYVTALDYAGSGSLYEKYWPANVHLVGKDILRFHAVYWPAFLMSAGLPLPRSVVAHGWWLRDEGKMSKSRGNVIEPNALLDEFGADAVRYFLMREMAFGQDASYSDEALVDRNNSDLANDLGNLVSRTLKLVKSSCDGRIPDPGPAIRKQAELTGPARAAHEGMMTSFERYDFSGGLASVWELVSAVNKFIVAREPWKLAEDPARKEELSGVLYQAAEALRIVALLVTPVMPDAARRLWTQLGTRDDPHNAELTHFKWGDLPPGQIIQWEGSLFPRIDKRAFFARSGQPDPKSQHRETGRSSVKEKQVEKKETATPESSFIDINTFRQLKLRAGKIISAEPVEGATKILKLQVDLGSETRQVVAGVAERYQPEQLVGKQIILVANLKPAVIRGVESQGMLLAAEDPSGAAIIATFEESVPLGATVR